MNILTLLSLSICIIAVVLLVYLTKVEDHGLVVLVLKIWAVVQSILIIAMFLDIVFNGVYTLCGGQALC